MAASAVCDQCGQACVKGDITTGYGIDEDGNRFCFRCCGVQDRESMVETGRAVLYLAKRNLSDGELAHGLMFSVGPGLGRRIGTHEVTNWPGSLRFRTWGPTKGSHNIAGSRYDVWFIGPDAEAWWGVQYGDWTQICHCKRLKSNGDAAQDVKRWARRVGLLTDRLQSKVAARVRA